MSAISLPSVRLTPLPRRFFFLARCHAPVSPVFGGHDLGTGLSPTVRNDTVFVNERPVRGLFLFLWNIWTFLISALLSPSLTLPLSLKRARHTREPHVYGIRGGERSSSSSVSPLRSFLPFLFIFIPSGFYCVTCCRCGKENKRDWEIKLSIAKRQILYLRR